MKFDPKLFAGAAIGGYLTGDTGNDYELLPTIAGAAVGAVSAANLDLRLPTSTFKNIRNEVSLSDVTYSGRVSREDRLSEISSLIDTFKTNNNSDYVFDPKNPVSTITEGNFKSALRYFEGLSESELRAALQVLREGPDAQVSLNPSLLRGSYKPTNTFITKGSDLKTKQNVVTQYLSDLDFNNVPEHIRMAESVTMQASIEKRVAELTPFLDRLEGNIILSDGVLKSSLEGEKFTLPLTTHLTDGSTLGHISNNNVYTSHSFNIMGATIATGIGSTTESAGLVAQQLGLSEGTEAYNNVLKMLVEKEGITREAALGVLASSNNVSNKALLKSVNSLSEFKQWDERATALHLESTFDRERGLAGGKQYELPEYTKKNAALIDMNTTLKYGNTGGNIGTGMFGDFSETALRKVETSTNQNSDGVESHKIRREMKFLGEDRVTSVKADHSLLFTPREYTGGLFNLNAPVSRNVGSVTNRALAVEGHGRRHKSFVVDPSTGGYTAINSSLTQDFKQLVNTFGSKAQFDSAIAINTAVFDEELVGEAFSTLFGSNVTLADGYALANRESFKNYGHSGLSRVKIQTDDGKVFTKNPVLRSVLDGSLDFTEAKKYADSFESFKPTRRKVLEENNMSFARAYDFMSKLKDPLDVVKLKDVVDPKHVGILDMLEGIGHKFERDSLGYNTPQEVKDKMLIRAYQEGVNTYFGSRVSLKTKRVEGYAKEVLDAHNAELASARTEFAKTRDYEELLRRVGEVSSSLTEYKTEMRNANKAIYPKGGSVIATGLGGSPEKVSESFSTNELIDISIRQGIGNENPTLEMTYRGFTPTTDNHVVKSFSVNLKEQLLMLDDKTFKSAAAAGHLLTTGDLTFNPETRTFFGDGFELTPDDARSFIKDRLPALEGVLANIDTISDKGGAGYKYDTRINNAISTLNPEDTKLISSPILQTIERVPEHLRQEGYVIAGLRDFVHATSTEKPSTTALLESILGAKKELGAIASNYLKGSTDTFSFSEKVGSLYQRDSRMPVTDRAAIVDSVMAAFDQRTNFLMEHFSETGGLFKAQVDVNTRDLLAEAFISNAKLRRASVDDFTHLGVIALNRKARTETGAGTTVKSMSWNAQTQLLANGYTQADIDLYATFDRSATNDMEALTGMTRKHDTLLNKAFEENSNLARNILSVIPEDRSALLLNATGLSNAKDVDFYNLAYRPSTGILAVPLMFGESSGFEGFISNETGAYKTKAIDSILTNIVEKDLEFKKATTHSQITSLQKELEGLHTRLENYLKPSLSGSSGVVKNAMTRTGRNSTLSTVGAINGEMTDFLSKESSLGRHASYAAVSYHGALDRLKLAGIEFTADEEDSFLKGTSKYLQDVEGFEGLKRIVVDDVPLAGLVNREPAQGPMSIRMTEFLLDQNIYDSEGARSSIFIKSKDPIYQFLQFGDYDFDTMTEYLPNYKTADKVALANTVQKGAEVSQSFAELYDFAKRLGVKNNKGDKISSLFDIMEKNPNIRTYEEWHSAYLNQTYDDATKAGLRKTISPKVTMLAAQLNNSLLEANSANTKEVQAGRVLTHYFIENLLKAQHSEGSGSGETLAERLVRLRGSDRSAYFKELREGLTDQLKNIDPKSSDYSLGQRAIGEIVTAEQSFMSNKPLNPMEIGGAIRGKNLGDSLSVIEGVFTGDGQAIPVHSVRSVEEDLANQARVVYDRARNVGTNFINNNKKVLAATALGLAGVSLAFREKPEYKATADVGRHSLEPHTGRNPVEGQELGKGSEYLTPKSMSKKAITIEGSYEGSSEDFRNNSRTSIFGDGIETARIEYRE